MGGTMATGIPGWLFEPVTIYAGVLIMFVLIGWMKLDDVLARRRAEAEAARRAAARRARQTRPMDSVTAQHRAIPPSVLTSGPRSPVDGRPVTGRERELLDTIKALRGQLAAMRRELAVRPDPDPVLSALAVRPLSLAQICQTVGLDSLDAESRLARLIHVTEQVTRVERPGRDPQYELAAFGSARRTLPARGRMIAR